MTRGEVAMKAAFVRQALDELARLPQATLEEFLADRRNLPAAVHWQQTAIQALIDVGLITVAARGLPAPRTSTEVLERLESAGVLGAGSAVRFRPVIGFRNRVVHLYDRVDPAIVYRIVREDRADLSDLLAMLIAASSAES